MLSISKLIIFFLIAYFIFLLIRFYKRIERKFRPQQPPRQISRTMVKDEVCHMYLPKEDAVRDIADGREVYFCSRDCRKKFFERRKNPDKPT